MKFLDLTQDFSLHTPAFAGYAGPAIRWIKRLEFDKAGGQEITMTCHSRPGGRWKPNPGIASSCSASASRAHSSPERPTSCTPTGNPS